MIPKPVLPNGNDTIKTTDGFHCSSSVSPLSYIDVGAYHNETESNSKEDADKGIYVRLLIPLYSETSRVDCSILYKKALKEREKEKVLSSIKRSVFN